MVRYTDERNAQILIALLKEYGIRKVILSPGTTNIPMSGSIQNDPYFETYSAYDERSAAYMACGLANESGEPVVLSCTGATASRNYMPGLTEAYYRKLPVLAVTSMNSSRNVGNLTEQTLDRSQIPHDIAKYSVNLDPVNNDADASYAELLVNRALSELSRNGGGPVHIQLISNYAATFTTTTLPLVRRIMRYTMEDEWPQLDSNSRIAIVMGAERAYSKQQEAVLDAFVEHHNAVVLTNNVSGYRGKHAVRGALACQQLVEGNPKAQELLPDLIIHLGEQSSSYEIMGYLDGKPIKVWRVSDDGEFRRRFKRLDAVFQCSKETFFEHYSQGDSFSDNSYELSWRQYDEGLRKTIPDFPFSNLWIGKQMSGKIPSNSVVHFGILNSARSWNNFEFDSSVETACNVGGFGIDGALSTLIGASLAHPDKLHFVVLGDLAFFYDMNSLGNRYVGRNVRVLLVNNNVGAEFKVSTHIGSQFGEQTDDFIAAGRHNIDHFEDRLTRGKPGHGPSPAQAWAESLGFRYLSAGSKEEFLSVSDEFLAEDGDRPILFECFTTAADEDAAHEMVLHIDNTRTLKGEAKQALKKVLPTNALRQLKKAIK